MKIRDCIDSQTLALWIITAALTASHSEGMIILLAFVTGDYLSQIFVSSLFHHFVVIFRAFFSLHSLLRTVQRTLSFIDSRYAQLEQTQNSRSSFYFRFASLLLSRTSFSAFRRNVGGVNSAGAPGSTSFQLANWYSLRSVSKNLASPSQTSESSSKLFDSNPHKIWSHLVQNCKVCKIVPTSHIALSWP